MSDLSEKQLQYLLDTDFLLTKEKISSKIVALLAEAEQVLRDELPTIHWPPAIPQGVIGKTGKISKGENYLGLPYWVLDFPRNFGKGDVFAFRTMVWWGHEASCTLHVSGKYLTALQTPKPGSGSIFFCVNKTPWEYHFEASNYKLLEELTPHTIESHLRNHQFMKIARKLPLTHLQSLPHWSADFFRESLHILH